MELREELQAAIDALGVPARPIVIETEWDIGPVAAYLLPDEPVTLIDSGVDTPNGRSAITEALAACGLKPEDVERVLVTHMHSDHFGGATWLQEVSGCEVLLHPTDLSMLASVNSKDAAREMLMPLGFNEALFAKFTEHEWTWRPPVFGPLGERYGSLRVEHHPGHSPGHVWIVEENTGAIFIGDYLLANMPTNAGMEIDHSQPMGRAPLLEQYNAGLRELRERDVPLLLPAHGPPITDHVALIDKRLAKSDRRTRHVLEGLSSGGPTTALALGKKLWGSRVENNWEVLADLVGRLDLLVAEGRASSQMGEDGCWYFRANT
jgi:glyoxylase-like metal-dependent hydrolase (beta-lactamase superfamily II)